MFRLTLLLLWSVLHSVEVRSLVREQCRVRKRPSSCGADSEEARDRGGWVRLISRRTEDISHHSLLPPFRGPYSYVLSYHSSLAHPVARRSPSTPTHTIQPTNTSVGWQAHGMAMPRHHVRAQASPRRVQAHATQITALFTIVPHQRLLRTSRNE